MQIRVESRSLTDVVVVVPEIFQDGRGFFTETFRAGSVRSPGIADSSLCRTIIRDLRKGSFADCISSGNHPWAS